MYVGYAVIDKMNYYNARVIVYIAYNGKMAAFE